MHIALSSSDEAFREEVRAFLDENLTPELRDAARLTASVFIDPRWGQAWHRILHRKGWVAPNWPVEHGGTGWTEMQRYIFEMECAAAGAPDLIPQGLRMCGPVLMRYGSEGQKAHYLPRILSGEDYWCQGYSEPGAGSDLAALQLRAVSDGDDYVLTGSKLWTTHAHFANRMFCLVRTSREGRPQAGITFLLLDMDSPGLTVRPIITLAEDHEVNEVVFDEVRVPKANRVGEENDGWTVAKHLLEFERSGALAPRLKSTLRRLRAVADRPPTEGGLQGDASYRRRLAQAEIEVEALEFTEHRVMAALSAGQAPGPASSLLKTRGTETLQLLDELAVEGAGLWAAVHQPAVREPEAANTGVGPTEHIPAMGRYLNNRAASIYGGSNEVQRNIMAKLVLSL